MASTIKDIRNETGLALSTISKYLNGGNVREENAVKIDAAVKKLDYHPNELARALITKQTRTVSFIVNDITSQFCGMMLRYAVERLRRYGYSAIFCDSDQDPALEASLEEKGIRIKRVMPPDFTKVHAFIKENFAASWADEALAAMMKGVCYVAVRDGKMLAFGCVGAIAPDYAGPGGTIPEARGLGINRAIVQKSFRYLKDQGFQYAVNGSVAPAERRIVERVVDVIAVEDSEDAYANLLRRR